MRKMALFDCAINKKCCSVDGGRGICFLFSSPPPGICHPRGKNANARGSALGVGWAQIELTDALPCRGPVTQTLTKTSSSY